jgi:hypothetical protein
MSLRLQTIGFRSLGLTDSGWRLGPLSLGSGSRSSLFSLKILLVKFQGIRNRIETLFIILYLLLLFHIKEFSYKRLRLRLYF